MSDYAIERVDWSDPYSYIREMYGVPAYEGARVEYNGNLGTVIASTTHHPGQYLLVRLDEGDRELIMLHPTWRMKWLDADRALGNPTADVSSAPDSPVSGSIPRGGETQCG